MSSATFYKWRARFGGMDASMVKRMKELEEENRRLKKMYAGERFKAEKVQKSPNHLEDAPYRRDFIFSCQ